MRRVAITGLGVISPVGITVDDFFNNLMAARSGVRFLNTDFSDKLTVRIAAETKYSALDYFTKKQLGLLDRTGEMALIAAMQAWQDAGIALDDLGKSHTGVYIGTGMGGAKSLDDICLQIYQKNVPRISPLSVVRVMSNASASHISMYYGLSGPCLTYSTACSASTVAIGEAFRQIKHGYSDIILAGGTECLLNHISFKSWESLGVLAKADPNDVSVSCRPFSQDRNGFVLGEGAAVVVLEELEHAQKRGAVIHCELLGYGLTADARHITSPSVDGQARAMKLALEEAALRPEDIDYINAHGTATTSNDIIETQAIKKVFGSYAYDIPISSTKSMHGHLLGAGGAVEFVAAVCSINKKAVPPTANLRVRDPECDLDYVPCKGRTGVAVRTVMSNSFAFGGTNAVLIASEV